MFPRLSMNEFSTFRWTFDRDVHSYAQAGYSGIGVWRRKLADYGEDDGIALLLDSGLAVSNLLWAGGFTGSSGLTFEESVDDALEAVRLGAAVGARCVVIHPGGLNNHIGKQAWRLFVEALEEILPLAEVLDVKLAIEPMHAAAARQWTFITSIDAALDTLARFQSPQLGLVLDLYHFGRCDEAMERALENVEDIAVVHLADSRTSPHEDQDRCPLGDGVIPIARSVERLEQAGYQGFYDVELVGPEIVPDQYECILRGSLEAVASTCPALL